MYISLNMYNNLQKLPNNITIEHTIKVKQEHQVE